MAHYRLPRSKASDFIAAAQAVCSHQWLDVLDCSVSWARQLSNEPIPEMLRLALEDERTFWTCIERSELGDRPAYFDIGFRMSVWGKDYFLWVIVPLEEGRRLVREFGLSECD